MTVREMAQTLPLGSLRTLPVFGGDLRIPVVVTDLRMSHGQMDALVAPLQGRGERWVAVALLEDAQVPDAPLVALRPAEGEEVDV